MSQLVIEDGGLVTVDPSDKPVLIFDWHTRHLALGVELADSSFTITAVRPPDDTGMTSDNESIGDMNLTLDSGAVLLANRYTLLRLLPGTLGAKYRVSNRIVTDEVPAQTKERSFFALVQNL